MRCDLRFLKEFGDCFILALNNGKEADLPTSLISRHCLSTLQTFLSPSLFSFSFWNIFFNTELTFISKTSASITAFESGTCEVFKIIQPYLGHLKDAEKRHFLLSKDIKTVSKQSEAYS